jgi:hypothetical protein
MIRKSNGFSLAELMIAVGIGAAVILGVAALIMSAYTQSHLITDAAEAEIDEMRAMNALQNVFAQSINVKFWKGVAPGDDLNNYVGADGQIREFDSDTYWTDPTHQAYPLAVFWREGQNSKANPQSSGGLTSNLKRTGIYFQKPKPPAPGQRSTWGVLYISQPQGVAPLSASRASDFFFGGFTRLRIMNVTTYDPTTSFQKSQAPVTSFEIELTFRRFFGQNTSDPRSFCPAAFIADCPENVKYKDIVRVSRITLRNNTIDASPSGPSGARLYDLIYFFHPLLPETKR